MNRTTRPGGERRRPAILIVSPALVGGSWILINELANRLAGEFEVRAAGLGRAVSQTGRVRPVRMPWLDYEEYGPKIGRKILALLWFEVPLALLALLVWTQCRPRIWLGNGLLSSAVGIVPQKIVSGHVVVSYNDYTGEGEPMRTRLSRLAAAHASLLFVNSQGSLEDASIFADVTKMRILAHAADDIFFTDGDPARLRSRVGLGARRVVAFVGRLDEEKHCGFLLRVIERTDPAKVGFVFAGSGPMSDQVQTLVARRDNVRYLGRITDRRELRDLYQMADVVWSYGDETYLAKPAVEALASGTPIIVPAVPAIQARWGTRARVRATLVPPGIGWIIPVDDPEAVAQMLVDPTNARTSAETRRRCREHAQAMYSSRNTSDALEEIRALMTKSPSTDHPAATPAEGAP